MLTDPVRAEPLMSEARLTSLTVESPPPARTIAVRARESKGNDGRPGLVWLGGFKSDMAGSKAVALDGWAEEHGRACLRFDYSGHGESGGEFKDGTIGRWLEESVAVYTQVLLWSAGAGRLVDGRLAGFAAGARGWLR